MRTELHPFVGRLVLGLLVTNLMVTGAYVHMAAAGQGPVRINVTIGKSQVLELKEAFDRVSVTEPRIADVFVVTPNQILINGKAVGVTSLVVFYPQKTQFFDLLVQTDLDLLRERLEQLAPRDKIEVRAAQKAVILQGAVSSEDLIPAASAVAAAFAAEGNVISLLSLRDVRPPQVLIQVQVAEVARTGLQELGFSARLIDGVFQGGAFPGTAFFPPIGLISDLTAPDLAFSDLANLFFASPNREFAGIVRALAERDLLRTLAKPNLVAESGKEASFLSGGEFPYPVAQETGESVTIQFKPFGVGLTFLPVVVDGSRINLRVEQEVSTLDFANAVVSAGTEVPTVRKNSAFTTVNMRDGESFAIAGLINNNVRQAVAKIPLLGDIPILGALFRSTRFQNDESELLFIVTVKLVEAYPPGSPAAPDPAKLLELTEKEKKEFTLVPGIPGVGEVVERPFGESRLQGM